MSIENTYKKVTQIEHILLRPDTYVGSVEANSQELWVWEDTSEDRFEYKEFVLCNALYKIFDEILVNAADNYQRDNSTDRISVKIQGNTIIIENTGEGIPVQIHKVHNVYVPELIFGHLLTSSNYDDKQLKVTGGRNGFGAKLTNIFSTFFKVETAHNSKLFTMSWTKNMSSHSEPQISSHHGPSFTRITFTPDLAKFRMTDLSPVYPLLYKRVMDLAGILPIKQVLLNDKNLRQRVKNFQDYARLYGIQKFAHQKQHRWEVLATNSDGQFQQVSFVNGICTTRGGCHVQHVTDPIVDAILEHIKKRHKDLKTLKPFQVKQFLRVFVNCLIVNPTFDSQTKETLTTKPSNFGSSFKVEDKFIDDLVKKTEIVQLVLLQAQSKLNKQLSKQLTAKKQQRLLGIEKLEDANDAGTKNAEHCTLILTEGDSAKSLAMAGIEIVGRDRYGVFPLRGKLLNVRDANAAQIMKNQEIEHLVKIMGLQFNKNYDSVKSLRYGSIMIMTDQDHDGHHIKGLIINLFDKFWPSLLKLRGFLKHFVTPIVKASHGQQVHSFFSIADYRHFTSEHPNTDFKVKYYKGLGTSTDQEAQQYFSNLNIHRKLFIYHDQSDSDYIDLAFNKGKADQRKQWLSGYSWNAIQDTLDYKQQAVRYRTFVTDCLAMHSISDNLRSIPQIIDGLKPTQRKILHTLLHHAKQEYKVSSLAGLAITYAQYHHGEVSMQQTITAMAQTFTGSNNLNLLLPIGQFGTRALQGKDAAQARYISTKLNPLTQRLFNDHDLHLLNYLDEEGHTVEPQWFIPILPTVLLNGGEGIGTGWSTAIPPFNPRELCEQMKRRMRGEQFEELTPWYKGFTGQILAGAGQYILKGSYILDKNTIYITELPPRKSIKEYQSLIQSKMDGDNPEVLDMKEYHAGNKVCFQVLVSDAVLKQDIEKYFKLSTTLSIQNMVLFDANGMIKKYASVCDVMEDFYKARIDYYGKRKEYLLSKYQNELDILTQKSKFLEGMIENSIPLRGLKKLEMCKKLASLGFKGIGSMNQIKSTKIAKESNSDNLEKQYDYLLSMPMWNFSEEKITEMRKSIKSLEKSIQTLQGTAPETLWSEDLNDFLDELDKAELAEDRETIKRVEKNAEKLLRGGAQMIKSIVMKSSEKFVQQRDESDYGSSDSEGDKKNPKILTQVIKEFANFGVISKRVKPDQKLRQANQQEKEKQSKNQAKVSEQSEGGQEIQMNLESDSEQQQRDESDEEVVKTKPKKRGEKQAVEEEIQKPQRTKAEPSAKATTEEQSNKKQRKPGKKPEVQQAREAKPNGGKTKKTEDIDEKLEKDIEKYEQQCKPAEALPINQEDDSDTNIFKKYGLGNFLRYLAPQSTADGQGDSLADRLLKRQKEGQVDTLIDTYERVKKEQESEKKHQENKRGSEAKQERLSDIDQFDFMFSIDDNALKATQQEDAKKGSGKKKRGGTGNGPSQGPTQQPAEEKQKGRRNYKAVKDAPEESGEELQRLGSGKKKKGPRSDSNSSFEVVEKKKRVKK